jgi:hypothetical protein
MKVNRTFSIDYHLVEKLRTRVNQSQTVCDALAAFLDNAGANEEEMTKQLMWIAGFCFTADLSPVETGQIITARDTILAFLQEKFQSTAAE